MSLAIPVPRTASSTINIPPHYTWRTIGKSDYNGLQVVLHKRFGHRPQGDFNYT